jgi:DNA primase large subunit
MERLHYYLCREKHLRHGGRLQYNLFLKGIGVSLNDALLFWKHYFTQRISHKQVIDNFNPRKIKYSIAKP